MKKKIDVRGQVCPIPVIEAKKALKEIQKDGEVSVIVDDEISKENLEKMAKEMGLNFVSDALNEDWYEVKIIKGSGVKEEFEVVEKAGSEGGTNNVVVISSDKMGEGSQELGEVLMKSFIYTLTESENIPSAILFYNAGAKLTIKNSPVLEDLEKLENTGVQILTCGTCLNYYDITSDLAVGTITNMYVILEKMASANKVIKP